MAEEPTLVVVGAASRDVDATDPRGWRLGGAVSYATLAAARLGLSVGAVIGADAEAATATELDLLRKAGARLHIVPLERGPVFDNHQVGRRRVQRCLETSDALIPSALPQAWRKVPAFLLAPIAGELGDEWTAAVPAGAFVGLAWQGLLRHLAPGEAVRNRPLFASTLVRRADVIGVSAEDAVAGGPPLTDLLRDGQTLLVTGGDKGALRIRRIPDRLNIRYVPPLPQPDAVDPTGAGDTFLAAYIAARLATSQTAAAQGGPRDDWRHLAVATAAASLSVAAAGLAGAPTLRAVCRELATPRP